MREVPNRPAGRKVLVRASEVALDLFEMALAFLWFLPLPLVGVLMAIRYLGLAPEANLVLLDAGRVNLLAALATAILAITFAAGSGSRHEVAATAREVVLHAVEETRVSSHWLLVGP